MIEKFPLNESGEGNCCPKCGSLKIFKLLTCYIEKEIKLNTGKERYINPITKRPSKMSNRVKAWKYSSADKVFFILKCDKCGWKSEIIKYE